MNGHCLLNSPATIKKNTAVFDYIHITCLRRVCHDCVYVTTLKGTSLMGTIYYNFYVLVQNIRHQNFIASFADEICLKHGA